jgi:hypothetical protein
MLARVARVAAGKAGPTRGQTFRPLAQPFFRSFAAAVPWSGGLLGTTATDTHYSKELDLREAAEMVSKRGILWAAAEADVKASDRGESVDEYLERVEQSAEAFLDRDELHGREAVMSTLRGLLRKKGQLVLMLGGKSLGKSFLLSKLAEEFEELEPFKAMQQAEATRIAATAANMRDSGDSVYAAAAASVDSKAEKLRADAECVKPRRVVVYDARNDGSDLVTGLLKAFSGSPSFFKKYEAYLKPLSGLTGVAASVAAATSAVPGASVAAMAAGKTADLVSRHLASVFADEKPTLSIVIEAFVLTCEAEGTFPCLIVDEANVAFEASTTEERVRTLVALRLLTRHTKQRKRMNVILAASEYSEPYRLSALGFKSDHFTDTVLMPEVSPKEMRDLLERKWGMGTNLATAFMSVWGGHIWAAVKGIDRLASGKASFSAIENPIAFSSDAVDGVTDCLAADYAASPLLAATTKEGGSMKDMVDMLEKIAISGYARLPSRKDPRAEVAGRCNVGGLLTTATLAPGVPSEAWSEGHAAVVVATNQAMRVMLASRLLAEGKRHAEEKRDANLP